MSQPRRHSHAGQRPQVQPPKPQRSVLVPLEEAEYGLLQDICEMLGIDEPETMKRGLALLANELTRQAILTPTDLLDDDDDDDDDDDEEDD